MRTIPQSIVKSRTLQYETSSVLRATTFGFITYSAIPEGESKPAAALLSLDSVCTRQIRGIIQLSEGSQDKGLFEHSLITLTKQLCT
jgi:hypothetical protein